MVVKPRAFLLLGLVALVLSLVLSPAANAAGSASVRVVHASPNAPNVDVYVDGGKALTNVPFFTAGNYLSVPAGNRLLQVTPTGQPVASAVISATVPFTANVAYTVAATGLVGGSGDQALGPTVLTDNLSAPAAGKAKVRVYHFSPDAPPVGVRVAGSATPLIPSLDFKAASDYLPVDTGTYTLEVFVAATPATVVETLSNVTLEAGKIYEIFATNVLASLTFETKVTNAVARVRIAHAAPDAPAVDVYIDGTKALSNVTFFNTGAYLDVPGGARLLQVTPAGQPVSSAVISTTATLNAGQAYTVAAIGLLQGNPPVPQRFTGAVLNDDLSPPATNKAKIRVYHFSPDAPAVDVRVQGQTTPVITNLAFGSASSYLEVDAGTYNFIVTPTGASAPQIPISNVQLQAGKIYDVFATNVLARITPQLRVTEPPRVRVVHASPDAPAVDVYVNGNRALQNVTFFTASDYLGALAGTNLLQVTLAGTSPNAAVISTTASLEMGRAYTVAAIGRVTNPPAGQALRGAIFNDDLSAPGFCQSKVRVYHFSPDAPGVDVRVKGTTTPLIPNLTFSNASNYLTVRSGTYNLEVTTTGASTVVIDLPNTRLQAGKIYDVFATDLLAEITPQLDVTVGDNAVQTCNHLPIIRK